MAKEDNKEDVAATGTLPVQQPKQSWRDYLKHRNPDLNTDDDEAISGYLNDSFSKYDEMENNRKALNDVLLKDDRAAGILTGLASGKDENGEAYSLTGYLLDKYWDELTQATSKEEAIAKAKQREADDLKKTAESSKRMKDAEENLKKSDAELDIAVQKTNIDGKMVADMLNWLYGTSAEDGSNNEDGFIHKIIKNQLDANDWERLIHAFNLDNERESYREEGRKEITAKRQGPTHRNLAEQVPTDLGSGGGSVDDEVKDPTIDRYRSMRRRV